VYARLVYACAVEPGVESVNGARAAGVADRLFDVADLFEPTAESEAKKAA
jgi:hypothetical protein